MASNVFKNWLLHYSVLALQTFFVKGRVASIKAILLKDNTLTCPQANELKRRDIRVQFYLQTFQLDGSGAIKTF